MLLGYRLVGAIKERYRRFTSAYKIALLRLNGAKIGSNVRVLGSFYLDGPGRHLSVGDNTVINHDVYINCREPVEIGSGCNISASVRIISTGLRVEGGIKGSHVSEQIKIGDDVWLGCNTVVLKGVTLPSGTVVGACSLVNKPISEAAIYFGIPVSRKS